LKSLLNTRFYRSPGWPIALVLVAALFCGGIARASHFHKLDLAPQDSQHLECLLCMDANHLAVPPPLLKPPVFQPAWLSTFESPAASPYSQLIEPFYDARGPPRR
jgi:hypothetical protein